MQINNNYDHLYVKITILHKQHFSNWGYIKNDTPLSGYNPLFIWLPSRTGKFYILGVVQKSIFHVSTYVTNSFIENYMTR